MATNGVYHWQSIMQATYSVGKITNAPNDVIFNITTNENDEQIRAEMKEMTLLSQCQWMQTPDLAI